MKERFRVDICADFSDRLKPWPEIRGEVIVYFFYFVRATMPFILLFYIFDTIISCIYTDILHCPLKLLHHLNIRIYFWLSMPAILLSTCMFHFALMATNY